MPAEPTYFRLRVEYDEDAMSPRAACSTTGTLLTWHRRYDWSDRCDLRRDTLPDTLCRMADDVQPGWDADEQSERDLMSVIDAHYLLMRVYMYEHSGICLSTRPFYDPWDSGVLGIIFVNKHDWVRENGCARWTDETEATARKQLEAEVQLMEDYISGRVYGVTVQSNTVDEWGNDPNEEGCWGFYGDDVEHNGMLGYVPEFLHQLCREAIKKPGVWFSHTMKETHV
jgi:hypothetical protein